MVNMSEDWRESILEDPVQDYRDMRRADQNRAGARGPEFSHDTKFLDLKANHNQEVHLSLKNPHPGEENLLIPHPDSKDHFPNCPSGGRKTSFFCIIGSSENH
jgi:hypothetical protein